MALAVLTACGAAAAPVAAPTPAGFDITPSAEVLSGEPVQIALRGLAPGSIVDVTAARPISPRWPGVKRALFRSHAQFRVGPDGTVALGTAAPLRGSYGGADPRGLFWSMAPTDAPIPDGWPDSRVELVASQRSRSVARAAITLRAAHPELEVTPVGAELPGAVLARLPGAAPRPAIIVLGGSEGGDLIARHAARRLASHGYAVLGLPYYAPSFLGPREDLAGLPAALRELPVDRLELARAWLQRAPGVDADRVALWGVSKGAELALIAATRMPWIDAVVAIVPTDVVWEGMDEAMGPAGRSSFSWRGAALPFVPLDTVARAPASDPAAPSPGAGPDLGRAHDAARRAHPERFAAARIPVERYRGAVLVVGGGDDRLWPSGAMAARIAQTRTAAGLATTVLIDPDAGHALWGDGWTPMAGPELEIFGGTPAATARAQAAGWRATLAFLARAVSP